MTKFEAIREKAGKQKSKWERDLDEQLNKKKYRVIFKHEELDYLIELLEQIDTNDKSDIRDLKDRLERKLPFPRNLSALNEKLMSAPEVEEGKNWQMKQTALTPAIAEVVKNIVIVSVMIMVTVGIVIKKK